MVIDLVKQPRSFSSATTWRVPFGQALARDLQMIGWFTGSLTPWISAPVDSRWVAAAVYVVHRLKVVEVVRRGDLDGAGPELPVDENCIADDRDRPVRQGKVNFLPIRSLIAGVFRMHCHGSVAEHGFGPRGGDGQADRVDRVSRG